MTLAATHLLPYDPVAKKRLSGTKRRSDDIVGDGYSRWMSHVGPVATDSLERRGTLASVSAREPVPQQHANHTDQNWDPGGGRIFIRDDHLYGAVVASMHGVDDGPGHESRTDLDSHANMPVVGTGAHVLVDHNLTCAATPIPQTTNLWRFHWWMLRCVTIVMGECTFC
jgi:hypothetical protein